MNRAYSAFFVLAVLTSGVFTSRVAHAQLGKITGIVYDADLRDELPGATVILRKLSGEAQSIITQRDGLFAFSRLFPAEYALSVSFVGFTAFTDTIAVAPGANLLIEVRLEPSTTELDEVVVDAATMDRNRFVAGLKHIRPDELTRIPMPDISYDLAGYLLTLPGFVSSGDRGGQLFVRGGTPTQNLVLLDGMTIYQPFHIIGFFSAFPADIIASTDVYAGGFGARYGGRISSVIDISTRNGSKQKTKAAVSIAPFLSTFRLETPVVKNVASLLVSVRQSMIDYVAPTFLGTDIPFRFGDVFVKFHAFLNQTTSFAATALRTSDQGNLSSTTALDRTRRLSTWRNEAYGVKYSYIPVDFPAQFVFRFNYSTLVSRYKISANERRDSETNGLTFKMEFNYLLDDTQIRMGVFGNLNRFEYELGNSPKNRSSVSSGGAYMDLRFIPTEYFRIEPGVRVESFSNGISGTIAPRIRAILQPRGKQGKHQFSAAAGRYYQQIVGLSNEQDVSDVFTIWAASPEATPVPDATHYLVGWKGRFKPWLELSVEGYLKNLHNIAFPVFSNQISGQPLFARISGEARGMDLKVETQFPNYFLSVNYTLARVEYFGNASTAQTGPVISQERFFPPHDRRHQLNVIGQIIRGRNKVSLRWQYGSGLPITQVNGYYSFKPITDVNDRSQLTASGADFVSRSSLYGARLPAYHRLDITFEHRIRHNDVETTFQVGVINVYDRANIFEYNVFSGERVNQLPFTPTIAVKVELL